MNATMNAETNHTAERNATRERILRAAGWLVGGVLRHQAVVAAMEEWNVSRRTAQVYVQKAANRLAREAEYDDPLFAMKLSQLQRDRLFQQLQNLQAKSYDMEPQEIRSFIQTIQAQLKVLDSRDRTAAKIAQLEAKHGRVESRRPRQCIEPPSVEQPSRATPQAARPETMRAAAQVTPAPRRTRQPKMTPHKEMRPATELQVPPAPRDEKCALETGEVGNKSPVAVAAA